MTARLFKAEGREFAIARCMFCGEETVVEIGGKNIIQRQGCEHYHTYSDFWNDIEFRR